MLSGRLLCACVRAVIIIYNTNFRPPRSSADRESRPPTDPYLCTYIYIRAYTQPVPRRCNCGNLPDLPGAREDARRDCCAAKYTPSRGLHYWHTACTDGGGGLKNDNIAITRARVSSADAGRELSTCHFWRGKKKKKKIMIFPLWISL